MDWLWNNTYLAAAIAAVAAIALYLLGQHNYASWAFMVLGILMMMRCEANRSEA